MGFELTRPLFLGAGAIALAAVVLVWWRIAPPLPPWRARMSLGLRVVIVLLLTGALAGFEFQTSPPEQSVMVLADLSASTQSAGAKSSYNGPLSPPILRYSTSINTYEPDCISVIPSTYESML